MTAPANLALGRVLGVIPARLASTRLPRKVLRLLNGEPLLGWVYRAARACPALDDILIAADSDEVLALCTERGWPCILTSPNLPSGTDRLYAVSRSVPADIYVNIQGDEPLLHPEHIAAILAPFTQPGSAAAATIDVTTLKVRCTPENIANPNAVKVVTAADGRALYFSRATIPYDRDAEGNARYWKHLGLYAYRRAALERFAALKPSELEQTERLEQLRLLENGLSLYVAETPYDTIGVDTEEDLQRVEAILRDRI
ncbi:3-deoxy-manno-octulosonate cytidylyltransferase [Granulicella sp. 5B5]|uniref:3-deoxy-manno-octulosonate cytidylyltransferase n=1 Tax=Granulicella sp. 5B5 TaxID=1617967 RepID=UPI0015F6B05B|nr:3-deoxy-manno-octulosonate cytidylyltransferase [Granulicella sp. 5B5]QMV17693.1 3-deoxy-manno-octulosonate cytidylyltransferase [Granulicella sp. 5B5]